MLHSVENFALNFIESYLRNIQDDYVSRNIIPERFATEKVGIVFRMISYHEDCYNPPKGLLMNARFATNKFVSEWFATKEFAIEWFATENIDIVLRKVYY